MRAIIDFDGTLTAEESQALPLAERSLDTLSREIIGVPRQRLVDDYAATRRQLLATPHLFWWEVNGLVASYCDEGAFILNTTTLQVMLRTDPAYERAVAAAFPQAEYDPVVDCTNYLFHRHTAELPPVFRPDARDVLSRLLASEWITPVVLTNSMGDKVRRHLDVLKLETEIEVLGDTRQYDMDPGWTQRFDLPGLGGIQVWPISDRRSIDLRRRVYFEALAEAQRRDPQLVVVADTLSLPGALPLTMGIPFLLLSTSYTPDWCAQVVENHPHGRLLPSLGELPGALADLSPG
jgi:hypothetical protein